MIEQCRVQAGFDSKGNFDGPTEKQAVSTCEQALLAHPESSYIKAYLGRVYYKLGRYQESKEMIVQAAQENIIAQCLMGVLYGNGYGFSVNFERAAEWYRKAAEAGLAVAQNNLGGLYADGNGVPKDDAQALRWYRKAAEQGYARALKIIGDLYAEGRVSDDALKLRASKEEGLKWYAKAGELGNIAAMMALAEIYAERDDGENYSEAIKWYTKAAELGNTEAMVKLGDLYAKREHYSEAAQWYRKAAEQEDGKARYNLGALYEAGNGVKQDYAEAVQWYKQAVEKDHTPALQRLIYLHRNNLIPRPTTDDYTSWLRKSVQLYLAQLEQEKEKSPSDLWDIMPRSEEEIALMRQAAEQNSIAAQISLGLYELYGPKRNFTAAETWLLHAKQAPWDQLAQQGLIAVADEAYNYAQELEQQERFGEAEPLYRQAVLLQESQGGNSLHSALQSLGKLYFTQGLYADAEPLFKRALSVQEAAGRSDAQLIQDLLYLADCASALHRPADAEPLLLRAKNLSKEPKITLTVLRHLAAFYQAQGRDKEAESAFKQVIVLAEQLGKKCDMTGMHDAEEQFLHALACGISSHLGGADYVEQIGELALLYLAQGRTQEAENLLLTGFDKAEKLQGKDALAAARWNDWIASLYLKLAKYEKAEGYSRRAVELQGKRAENAKGRGALAEQKKNAALFVTRIALASHLPETGARLQAALDAMQYARATDTGAAIAQMAARFAQGDDALGKLVREQQDASAYLATLEKKLLDLVGRPVSERPEGLEDKLRQAIADATQSLNGLNARIDRDFPNYQSMVSPRPLPLAETQSLLGKNEAMLVWIFGEREGYLQLVRRERSKLYRLALPRDELERDIKALRASLQHGSAYPGQIAYELYRKLLAPAAAELTDIRHLLLVPSGALESLPLSVLWTAAPTTKAQSGAQLGKNEDTRGAQRISEVDSSSMGINDNAVFKDAPWLMRRWSYSVLPTVSALKALRAFTRTAALGIFKGVGDPVLAARSGSARGVPDDLSALYTRGSANVAAIAQLPSLPETRDELTAMAAYLQTPLADALLVGADATETHVKRGDLSSKRVVAFATHGLMAGELKGLAEPALVMTPPQQASAEDDGLLTASEIAQLSLNADWVILSACNTAAGDGQPGTDGLSGMAKAFLYAGTRALLVSHWEVVSSAAVKLTTRALEYSASGTAKAEALRLSMLNYLADDKNTEHLHPRYWAPFVLVGEGEKK